MIKVLPWSNTTQFCSQIGSHLLCSLPSHLSQIATSLRFDLSDRATSLFSHLSHCATSLHSHTFPSIGTAFSSHTFLTLQTHHSATFPSPPPPPSTTSRHLLYTNVPLPSREGKHVWLIKRQSLMKAGCWKAPLALRDLAEGISSFREWSKQVFDSL